MQNPSFARKVKHYMNGRDPWEVRYPMGVEANGVFQLTPTVWELDLKQVVKGVTEDAYLTHVSVASEKDKLQLSEVVPGSLFDQIGLQDGDVITFINDHPIKNRMDLLQVYQTMDHDAEFDVQFLRNDQAYTFSLLVVDK